MNGYRSRSVRTRRCKNILVIVCEGEKTEVQYFESFRKRNSGVNIKPIHGKCTDPKNIVKFANKCIDKWGINFKEGDGIWCVFDVDENRDEAIKDAVKQAENNTIQVALSNPCFELWYLLHFEYIRSQISRVEAYERLREDFIQGYEKNMKVYDRLLEKLPGAIKNSKELNKMHEDDHVDLFTKESNPSSQVYKLVEFINELYKKNIVEDDS